MIYLKELTQCDKDKAYEFLTSIKSENGFENIYENISKEDFVNKALKEREESSKGINLKDGYVPDTYFLLFDDNEIVGCFKVRHYLNAYLRNGPGHIGYIIDPKKRNHGYGSRGLKLTLQQLITMPDFKEDEIYFETHLDNKVSQKMILNNGGYVHHTADKFCYLRIHLNKIQK